MAEIFDRFANKAPVAVMARASLEFALEPSGLDALFARCADRQYERKLLFSTMVDLTAVVVCGVHPSVHAAYKALREQLPVSLTALYEKMGGVEVGTTEGLVAYSAQRLGPVIDSLGAVKPWLDGYRIRVLDGNHLAATDHRLEVLRDTAAGPLPGQALVVLEPERGLVAQMVGCEDGHAQERSLLGPIVAGAQANDMYLADRNFCVLAFLFAMACERKAFFGIRQHANLPIDSAGTLRKCGRTETGVVYEQSITLRLNDRELRARRIVIKLDTPTRDGDTEMAIITNLPRIVDACTVADLYRRRWTIESFFARIERYLQSELSGLGYPRAALFGFGVALAAANVFGVVSAAMEVAKRTKPEVAGMPLSDFAIVEESRTVNGGMEIILDDEAWRPFHTMPATQFAKRLLALAENIDWRRYRKAVRGPKKPVTPRKRFKNKPHVSTARLLGAAKGAKSAQG